MAVFKIITGGQTGVDQAALQAAIDSGVEHGGWCPPGRVCENGEIPLKFKLEETTTDRYDPNSPPRSMRTYLNVQDSDGSLMLFEAEQSPGTLFTIGQAMKLKRPLLRSDGQDVGEVIKWVKNFDIQTLNVAGPSENEKPGVYNRAYQFVMQVLETMRFSNR